MINPFYISRMSYESWLSETVTYHLTKKKNNKQQQPQQQQQQQQKHKQLYFDRLCSQKYIIYMLQAALLYFQNLANNYFSKAMPIFFNFILFWSGFKIFTNDWL